MEGYRVEKKPMTKRFLLEMNERRSISYLKMTDFERP